MACRYSLLVHIAACPREVGGTCGYGPSGPWEFRVHRALCGRFHTPPEHIHVSMVLPPTPEPSSTSAPHLQKSVLGSMETIAKSPGDLSGDLFDGSWGGGGARVAQGHDHLILLLVVSSGIWKSGDPDLGRSGTDGKSKSRGGLRNVCKKCPRRSVWRLFRWIVGGSACQGGRNEYFKCFIKTGAV